MCSKRGLNSLSLGHWLLPNISCCNKRKLKSVLGLVRVEGFRYDSKEGSGVRGWKLPDREHMRKRRPETNVRLNSASLELQLV